MGKTEIELLEEISTKLDRLIGILAIQGKDSQTQARIMRTQGLTIKETSNLTGIAEGTLKTWERKTRLDKLPKTEKEKEQASVSINEEQNQ